MSTADRIERDGVVVEPASTSRRAFLRDGTLLLAAGALGTSRAAELFADDDAGADKPLARIGLITDMHYADKAPGGTRHYRESRDKLREAVAQFARDKPNFVVELGDLIDKAETVEKEIGYLKTIEKEYAALKCPRHYVLGNHCVATLTKEQFLDNCGAQKPYYSFDDGNHHFVVLDACFNKDLESYRPGNFVWSDANIPPAEIEWLADDLKNTKRKTIVFAHQRLDIKAAHTVKNAAAVRRVLEASGKVLAVFQGHHHRNDHHEIGDIHYLTMAAMVEGSGAKNSAYSTIDILKGDALRVSGFRTQKSDQL